MKLRLLLGIGLLGVGALSLLVSAPRPPSPGDRPIPAPDGQGTVRGRVVDAAGHPMPDARARLDANGLVTEAAVDGAGRFELSAPHGPYLLFGVRAEDPGGDVWGPPRLVELSAVDLEVMDLIMPVEGTVGIDVRLAREGAAIVVTEVAPGGAGERAGLEVGDRVDAIDGIEMTGQALVDAQRALQGAPNSTVVLTVAGDPPRGVEVAR